MLYRVDYKLPHKTSFSPFAWFVDKDDAKQFIFDHQLANLNYLYSIVEDMPRDRIKGN